MSSSWTCAICQQPVNDGSNLAFVDKSVFHDACLNCFECGRELQEYCGILSRTSVPIRRGKVESEVSKSESSTEKSTKTIVDENVRSFCVQCMQLRNTKRKKCHGCEKIFGVSETIIRAAGKRWHEACFVCSYHKCKAVITEQYFMDSNNAQYCSLQCRQTVTEYSTASILTTPLSPLNSLSIPLHSVYDDTSATVTAGLSFIEATDKDSVEPTILY